MPYLAASAARSSVTYVQTNDATGGGGLLGAKADGDSSDNDAITNSLSYGHSQPSTDMYASAETTAEEDPNAESKSDSKSHAQASVLNLAST